MCIPWNNVTNGLSGLVSGYLGPVRSGQGDTRVVLGLVGLQGSHRHVSWVCLVRPYRCLDKAVSSPDVVWNQFKLIVLVRGCEIKNVQDLWWNKNGQKDEKGTTLSPSPPLRLTELLPPQPLALLAPSMLTTTVSSGNVTWLVDPLSSPSSYL